MEMTMSLANQLRNQTEAIVRQWETEVLELVPSLQSLERSMLIDHLPEFLHGLAEWVDGHADRARAGFNALAEGHAVQRLGAGIDLEAVTTEYAVLRRVVIEQLVSVSTPEAYVRAAAMLNAGIDHAVHEAVYRYAKARDHVRERFIGILGHDLRDPLSSVIMAATILEQTLLDAKQTGLLHRLMRGALRIERMIDDVLDFARGRLSGGIPVNLELGDLGTICRAATDEMADAEVNRRLLLEIRGDLRGMWDADRVRQALSNLLSNARHYGTGDIALRAWESEDRQRVFTSVTNAGKVIPSDVLKRIFDPYSRGGTGGRRGLGLGLYIVQQIALAHGGVCRVESTEASGTVVTIEWPRVPIEEVADRA
jgi:signal transduction histidine kinase